MKKSLLVLSIFLSAASVVLAQEDENKKSKKELRRERINAIAKQEEEGVIKYKKHTVFGGKLTSDGYGGFIEIGRAQSISKALLFQLEITERKHETEEKTQYNFATTAPIIYAKRNFFYPVKLGVQQQFLLGNKGNKNGVSVTGNAGGGLIVGLLRPYSIEVRDSSDRRKFVTYESDPALFLNTDGFIGGPGLGKGWSNLKVTPGAYLKPSLRFDYGKYNEMVNALEVGVIAEFYSKKIPQMLYAKEKQFFFSAYIAIMFGKRK